MDGGTAVARVLSVERSYKKEIEKLLMGSGDLFHGEGILAIPKPCFNLELVMLGVILGPPCRT